MPSRSILVVFLVAAPLALACAPSATPSPTATPNTVTVSGTVGSGTLKATSAVAEFVPLFPPGNAPAVPALRILLSDKANSCDALHFASSTNLELRLIAVTPVAIKSYPIVDANQAAPSDGQIEANFNAVDGTCKDVVAQTATTGSVTLVGAHFTGENNVRGSVDVTFAGGHLSGDFNAVFCGTADVDASVGADAGALITTCTP